MNTNSTQQTALKALLPYAAGLCGILGLVLFFMGLGLAGLLPLPERASAEQTREAEGSVPSAVLPWQRAALLQSSVDSAALSLSGVAGEAPGAFPAEEQTAPQALSRAMEALTFDLGGTVFFTAWQGTTMLYSPLTPDASGLDFAEALDERGVAFVRLMHEMADKGGGFMQVTLPRMAPGQTKEPRCRSVRGSLATAQGAAEPAENALEASDGDLFPPDAVHTVFEESAGGAGACVLGASGNIRSRDGAPVLHVLYVRMVPESRWHIAAFMAADNTAPWLENSFSSAVKGQERLRLETARKELSKGLSLSGFSLAALAGLLLVPATGRKRTGGDTVAGRNGPAG